MRPRFVLLAALGFCACESSLHPGFQPQLVLHCLLQTGSDRVRATLNRTYRIDEPFQPDFPDGELILSRKGIRWGFVYAGGDSYVTRDTVPVNPGDTFFISAAKPGFPTISQSTVVPAAFEILFPGPGDTVTVADSLVFTRSKNCAGYLMSFLRRGVRDTFHFDILIPNDSFTPGYDSTRVKLPRMLFLFLIAPPPESAARPCTLRIWALDTNYYRWLGASTSQPAAPGKNGPAVLGSAVERQIPVFVRSDTFVPPRESGR